VALQRALDRGICDEPLSHYAVHSQPDEKYVRAIVEPCRFETRFRSPQLEGWKQGEVAWHLVKRLPDDAPGRRKQAVGKCVQQEFFFPEPTWVGDEGQPLEPKRSCFCKMRGPDVDRGEESMLDCCGGSTKELTLLTKGTPMKVYTRLI